MSRAVEKAAAFTSGFRDMQAASYTAPKIIEFLDYREAAKDRDDILSLKSVPPEYNISNYRAL